MDPYFLGHVVARCPILLAIDGLVPEIMHRALVERGLHPDRLGSKSLSSCLSIRGVPPGQALWTFKTQITLADCARVTPEREGFERPVGVAAGFPVCVVAKGGASESGKPYFRIQAVVKIPYEKDC